MLPGDGFSETLESTIRHTKTRGHDILHRKTVFGNWNAPLKHGPCRSRRVRRR